MKLPALFFAAAAIGLSTPAFAHAVLVKANPGAGQSLRAGPAKVELHFNEAPESAFSGIAVTDSKNRDMVAAPVVAHDSQLVAPLKPLAPGRYRVRWHAVSRDTHRSDGSYDFLVLAAAHPATVATTGITVTDAWIRSLPGNLPAGGYFGLHNGTAKKVTLTGASSPACGMLMLHKSETMSGMASMSDVETIDVPSGGTVKFAPGGYHLMCMDPAPAIRRGNTVTIEFEFADGTKVRAAFAVRGANGR